MNLVISIPGRPLWAAAFTIDAWLYQLFTLACLILAIVALVKCLAKNADLFFARGKRTKNFWMAMTAGACVLALIGLSGPGIFGLMLPVAAACMAAVYLADVDPEVSA